MTAVIPQDRQGQMGQMRAMADLTGLCAVQLIDRRTGAIHRMNGRPLLVVTRKPQDAATDLMAGRDPSVWEARIDTIEQIAR